MKDDKRLGMENGTCYNLRWYALGGGYDLPEHGYLRSRCEANVIKGCCSKSRGIMRADKESPGNGGIHGQGL